MWIRNARWQQQQDLFFYIGHYGKMNNRFFLDHKLENSNHCRKNLSDLMEKCKKRYSQEAQN
jgi:hypothetical protein